MTGPLSGAGFFLLLEGIFNLPVNTLWKVKAERHATPTSRLIYP